MKILYIGLYRHTSDSTDPVRLAHVEEMSAFNFFTRKTVSQHTQFAARSMVQRCPEGVRQSVQLDEETPFIVHCYHRADKLAGAVVTDKEYPQRVAYGLLSKEMKTFEDMSGQGWTKIAEDQDLAPDFMQKDIAEYQDPKSADKMAKIKDNLDQITDVMHRNIEQVLKRGEDLDKLMDKSTDLSATSVTFYKKAKKQNQCCKAY